MLTAVIAGAALILLALGIGLYAKKVQEERERAAHYAQERHRIAWDAYVAQQHHYIERLLRDGVVPAYEACPQFFAQEVSGDLVNLARCINAVHTVKTAKARSNNMETVNRLLQTMPAQKMAELTAESGNVIARVVTEAAEFVYMAALRDDVGKHLAAAGRAKRPETRQKCLAAAISAIDAAPSVWKHPDGPAVVAALREAIVQVAANDAQSQEVRCLH